MQKSSDRRLKSASHIPSLRRVTPLETAAPLSYEFFHDLIECLVAALECKDAYTHGHSARVADMSLDISRALKVEGIELENIHFAAHLHDIGKIGVADGLLSKSGSLLPHEWAQVQAHSVIGHNILSKSKRLEQIAKIVLHHHERWDGGGYPAGLQGEYIPLGARVIAVADAVDAMTTDRPYKKRISWDACFRELQINRETQFDPLIVGVASQLWRGWALKHP